MSASAAGVMAWGKEEVRAWLARIGLQRYSETLCDVHNMDGPALLMLQESDLRQPPLQMVVLGDIKKLLFHLAELRLDSPPLGSRALYCLAPKPSSSYSLASDSSPTRSQSLLQEAKQESLSTTTSDEEGDVTQSAAGDTSFPLARGEKLNLLCKTCQTVLRSPKSSSATPFPAERWKTALALMYGMAVSWLTALVMTVVHDRVPDMAKYPPLPDIILDNVPHIPWAFEMTELTGMTLLLIWFIMIICHKHRWIIARRFFAIAGTIFLLRCVTMLITSLSVPGVHLDCKPRPYGNWANRLRNAYIIWSGAGMSLQGVRTCGDYMFSGHTVSLTLLNFFITEYTSRRIYFLHTFTWLLNCFGVFFILAAHEHYSIDVFVAFYITSRLFLYYHTLVNNRAVSKYQESFDAKRTWFYFPVFSFLEENVDGRIPNVFELPLAPQDISDALNGLFHTIKNKFNDFQNRNEQAVQRKDKKRAKHN